MPARAPARANPVAARAGACRRRRRSLPSAVGRRLLAVLLVLGPAAALPAAETPNARVQQPPVVHFFVVPLEPVRDRPPGTVVPSLDVAYSSVFQRESAQRGLTVYDADLEFLTVVPRLAWQPTRRLELAAALPIHHAGGGFLDRPIQDFHDVFGFDSGGRDLVPNDAFRSRLVVDGRLVYEGGRGAGVGDLEITQSWRLLGARAAPVRVALRTGVELPTGDAERGFGSGAVDVGAALAATLERERFAVHLQGLVSLPGDLAGESRVATHAAYGFGAAAEATIVPDRVLALAQVDARTGFTSGTGLDVLDGDLVQLAAGVGVRVGRAWLTLGFAEDLRPGTSPDVTFLMRISLALD